MLGEGQSVRLLRRGVQAQVGRFLGEGGEGTVFEVEVGGARHALKWYHPNRADDDRRASLSDLIDRGSPHPRFLWPLDVATSDDEPEFGYVMALRPDGFVAASDLVSGRAEAGLGETARIGFELADSFLRIHALGLCYRDINFGNVFLNPDTGAVLICDNDNVGIDGLAGSVLGVPYFMAPEVLRGETLPNRRTDLHSLAVMLFYLMMAGHPLDGARADEYDCFDEAARISLFGHRPLFVFDPSNDANALDIDTQMATIALWAIYPQFIKDRFVEAFTVGLTDPDARVLESVWRKALVRLGANVCYCGVCGAHNFADGPDQCWNCQSPVPRPPALVIGDLEVMLNHDTTVRSYQVDLDYDRDEPFAEMTRNPQNDALWGLRNLSGTTWQATHPTGGQRTVAPGRSIALASGLILELGPVSAKVV
jgi:DNA-binding helix-hairpin-helix protein with protein kinase domain